MRRLTVFLFVVACTLLALYTSAGCSGGLDAMSLSNLESEALNTCDTTGCLEEDTDVTAEGLDVTASIHENIICTDDEAVSAGKSAPFRLTTGDPVVLTHGPAPLCGRHISPPQVLSTHEPVLPFQPVVFCNDTEIPLNNPHSSCGASSDINSTYINVAAQDYGVCVLRLDDQVVSSPLFVYLNNGVELTRHEILRTCVERMSCLMGVFRSAAIPLIEAANESTVTSSDITLTVLRTVDNTVVEASDMGNMANAVLVLDDVELPIDDDIVSHNQYHVDTVITFIEDNCVE